MKAETLELIGGPLDGTKLASAQLDDGDEYDVLVLVTLDAQDGAIIARAALPHERRTSREVVYKRAAHARVARFERFIDDSSAGA